MAEFSSRLRENIILEIVKSYLRTIEKDAKLHVDVEDRNFKGYEWSLLSEFGNIMDNSDELIGRQAHSHLVMIEQGFFDEKERSGN